MNREEIRKELEDLSPFLSQLEKKNPFEVPVHYFDRLPDQVLEQTRLTVRREPVNPPQESWLDKLMNSLALILQPRVAMALATVAIVVWGGLTLWQNDQSSTTLADGTWIEIEEASAYLAANIDELDDGLLMEIVLETGNDINSALPETIDEDDQLINDILDELEDVDIEDLL